MPELVYRVVAAAGGLGYGFPAESLDRACEGRIDAVICDGGSIDPGPYYLGTGKQYFERASVKRDFSLMTAAATAKSAKLIVGTVGIAGADRSVDWMLDVAREVFAEQRVSAKVAVIRADVDPEQLVAQRAAGRIRELGPMPDLDDESIRASTIVAQMGIHPFIAALDEGADVVLAGRACDVVVYAGDMVRRGIDPGLAYHAGHVLECGALACDPGTASDCLVGEIYDDGSARFVAPDPARRCTPYSIGAHALYEEAHPALQRYPEGVLVLTDTDYTAVDSATTGVRNSVLACPPAADGSGLTVKVEGSRRVSSRRVSLCRIDPARIGDVPAGYTAYGRNGVQDTPVAADEREVGILIETRSDSPDAAEGLALMLTHYLIHFGYPGRRSTAGNVAYPLCPNDISFTRADGSFGAAVIQGTRDPIFQENWSSIREAVIERVKAASPEALEAATYSITIHDADDPIVLLRTLDSDHERLTTRHADELRSLRDAVGQFRDGSLLEIDTADEYEWSIYHLLTNVSLIRDELFPIEWFDTTGGTWVPAGTSRPSYDSIGAVAYTGNMDEHTLSAIPNIEANRAIIEHRPLREMALVIRSKNAGVNRITFDVLFRDADQYAAGLSSNAFSKPNMAKLLQIDEKHVVGSFAVENCNAIKITIDRAHPSGWNGEKDVFGAQQGAPLINLLVPVREQGDAR